MKRLLISSLLVTLLVGCGGGGGGTSNSASNESASNPLSKYVGSYASACSYAGTHRKDIATVTLNGNGTLTIAIQEVYYDESKCAGAVVGIATIAPVTVSHQATSTEFVTGLAYAIAFDKISVTAPASTTRFVGSNVVGSCVTYQNGRTCYDSLTRTGGTANGGLYLEGSNFYTLIVGGVGYKIDTVMTKA